MKKIKTAASRPASPAPNSPGMPPLKLGKDGKPLYCGFFEKGNCLKGDKCDRSHDPKDKPRSRPKSGAPAVVINQEGTEDLFDE